MRNIITTTLFLFIAAIPALASAEITAGKIVENTVHITYSASDLENESGRKELELRIRMAAEKVCGSQQLRGAGSLRQLAINRTCYQNAVQEAVGSIPAIG